MINHEQEQAAIIHLRAAYWHSRAHTRLADRAMSLYGDHGSLIAGVVRNHFPAPIKAKLRYHARSVTSLLDKSRASWRLSGRRFASWMKAKELVISQDGRGFYG